MLLVTIASTQSTLAGKGKDSVKGAPKAEPLTLRVTPLFALAGSPVQAMVRIPPNADNRLLRIMVDSENYFQSSDVELAGLEAAVTHYVPMKALPAGRYELLAVVYGTQGERARIDQQFRLLSPSEASEDDEWMRRRR